MAKVSFNALDANAGLPSDFEIPNDLVPGIEYEFEVGELTNVAPIRRTATVAASNAQNVSNVVLGLNAPGRNDVEMPPESKIKVFATFTPQAGGAGSFAIDITWS